MVGAQAVRTIFIGLARVTVGKLVSEIVKMKAWVPTG